MGLVWLGGVEGSWFVCVVWGLRKVLEAQKGLGGVDEGSVGGLRREGRPTPNCHETLAK